MNDFVSTENITFTDVHSHVLPSLDDGSRDPAESIEMLKMSKASGVGRMIATPHFYPDLDDPERFLKRREASAKALADAVKNSGVFSEIPTVGLGAEVAFFNGISRSAAIKDLRILGTDLILIEMPFERWSASVLDELLSVRSNLGLCPIVAHLERYFDTQTKEIFAKLFSGDVLIQMNAEAFSCRKTSRKALAALKNGNVELIGSDCHNIVNRVPNLGDAVAIIEKKLGKEAVNELRDFSFSAFESAEPIF